MFCSMLCRRRALRRHRRQLSVDRKWKKRKTSDKKEKPTCSLARWWWWWWHRNTLWLSTLANGWLAAEVCNAKSVSESECGQRLVGSVENCMHSPRMDGFNSTCFAGKMCMVISTSPAFDILTSAMSLMAPKRGVDTNVIIQLRF